MSVLVFYDHVAVGWSAVAKEAALMKSWIWYNTWVDQLRFLAKNLVMRATIGLHALMLSKGELLHWIFGRAGCPLANWLGLGWTLSKKRGSLA